MQRQVVRSVNGQIVHGYEDCGLGRATSRAVGHLDPMPNGGRTMFSGIAGDFMFPHPASQVTKQPGDKVSR